MGVGKKNARIVRRPLPKCLTGISGFDEITLGGLPRGRPTLVCGGAGCGKSLFGIEFLVRGATQFNEPGVLMTFEEPVRDVTQNVTSLGFDLDALVAGKKLALDHVRVERNEIEEAGDYDLEGLFIRLNYAIDSVGAKRVVLDTLESLFSGFANHAILRAELRRLFGWLKTKGVTAIITGERGEAALTRQGLEEYVSDCVISLDHRVIEQVSTRRLRVVKYRGSTHGTNEYPFLIDEDGISVLPVTSAGLAHEASSERIPTGVKDLDAMLGGKGYFRGSSILVSGTAGTGKSTLAAHFADATCRRGERCLYFAFEESPHQILRNMRSVGLELDRHVAGGKLRFHASRPTLYGLETHLATVHKQIADFQPKAVVVDPISNLTTAGSTFEVRAMLLRLIDFLKMRQITALLTNLTAGGTILEGTDVSVSSLVDTWLLLRNLEHNGERNRGIYVLKSRGMAHSNQVREFLITADGVKLVDVYLGPAGMLTGSARVAQAAREAADELKRRQEADRKRRALGNKRQAMEAHVLALRAAYAAEAEEALGEVSIDRQRRQQLGGDRAEMPRSRGTGAGKAGGNGNGNGARAAHG
ncbi:MAG: circadian clock protein KaiC [Phycisphaerales bacterium]|nr:circadian clock protein KaiC [Phycisphaerales bacterium]